MKFVAKDAINEKNSYIVTLEDNAHLMSKFFYETGTTRNIFQARLLGLSFMDFLRYVRDSFNAKIIIDKGYPTIVWDNLSDAKKYINFMNARLNYFSKNILAE